MIERDLARYLHDLEYCYQHVQEQAERAREERNAGIREAIAAGKTHAEIAEAMGHSRGWVSGQVK